MSNIRDIPHPIIIPKRGRPSSDNSMRHHVGTRLSDRDHAAMTARIKLSRSNHCKWIREAIREYLRKEVK